jgi:hypothetical protein
MQYTEVITDAVTGKQTVRNFTQAEIAAWQAASIPSDEQQKASRQVAYREEADPLFFKAQRGDGTLDEWKAKVDEIKARFPYAAE